MGNVHLDPPSTQKHDMRLYHIMNQNFNHLLEIFGGSRYYVICKLSSINLGCLSLGFLHNPRRTHLSSMCFCLFTHSLIHSFIYSFIHLFIHSLSHSFIKSFIHSFISFFHSFSHSCHSFIYSFIYLFMHSVIHSSFIH